MKDIREVLSSLYENEDEMLRQFRNSVVNRHHHYRFKVENDRANVVAGEDWYELKDYDYNNFHIGLSEVVDIFNLLDLPIMCIKIEEGFDTLTEDKYQYCSYLDFWGIISGKNDFDFFISLVCISQLELRQENLKELQSIVKSALKNKGFKIPNFKPSVFVAMSFDEDLEKVRAAISNVIKDEGLTPLLIDSKEHNNQIVPEIFNEIDKAKFVIADLTHHKAGVYYEAGYAKGKGKEVIFTCRKSDFENRHFDVAQTNTIVWETPEELSERLVKRIEAMTLMSDNHDRLKSPVSVPVA